MTSIGLIGAAVALPAAASATATGGHTSATWQGKVSSEARSTKLIHVAGGSLALPAGQASMGARFEITGVREHAPASISVRLSSGATVRAGLSARAGAVAYYRATWSNGARVSDATAVVDSRWSGQFRLACYRFAESGSGSGSDSGTMVISVAPSSLAVPAGKSAMGARFEITGVREHAPASISVRLSTGATVRAGLSARVGAVAYYRASWAAGARVTGATAVVPTGWSGQFRLVCYRFASTGSGSGSGSGSGTMVVQVTPGSLAVPAGKVPVGARFEITGVRKHAPESISVRLSTGTTVNAGLASRAGTVAFYRATWPAGATVTNATAVVPTGWSGQFRLVCYRFASTGSGSGSGFGSGTMVIHLTPGSLAVPAGKVAVGARFEITGVREHAPSSISVQLSTGSMVTARLSDQIGATAMYRVSWAAGASVTNASATVPRNWAGEFRLVSYEFQSGTTGSGTTGSGTTGSGTTGSGTTASGATGSPAAGGTGSSVSAVAGASTGASASAGRSASGTAVTGGLLTGAQAGSAGSGFPAGATGQVAPTGHRGPFWPLVGFGIAGLLGAAALRTRAADGKRSA